MTVLFALSVLSLFFGFKDSLYQASSTVVPVRPLILFAIGMLCLAIERGLFG